MGLGANRAGRGAMGWGGVGRGVERRARRGWQGGGGWWEGMRGERAADAADLHQSLFEIARRLCRTNTQKPGVSIHTNRYGEARDGVLLCVFMVGVQRHTSAHARTMHARANTHTRATLHAHARTRTWYPRPSRPSRRCPLRLWCCRKRTQVCACVRARARVCGCVRVRVCVCVYVCMCACARLSVRLLHAACVRVRVCT